MRFWTKAEDQKLCDYYRTLNSNSEGLLQFAKRINRTARAAINRGVLLRLTSTKHRGIVKRSGTQNTVWKGDVACNSSKRERCQRRFKLGKCERCGKRGTDRHHKDGNPGNNNPRNVMVVCRRCHMIIDGRLESSIKRLKQLSSVFKRAKKCLACKRPYKPLRHGRCAACQAFFRTHGRDHPKGYKLAQRAVGFDPNYSNPRSDR